MSTIKDVAKHAGVSTATVSYILNNTKTVLPETRKRVLKAIKDLNYTPNPTAQSFKTGKKNTIAFILPDISNSYFANIAKAIEATLSENGYSLILANTNESIQSEIEHLKYMTAGFADGIILASTAANFSEIKPHIPKKFPMVLIDRKLTDCPYDVISSTDDDAIFKGVQKLVEQGHKKIGYIGDIPHLSTAIERHRAYQKALSAVGIDVDEKIIVHVSSLTHDAYQKTGELLQAGCTAIMVSNNMMTIDACSYILNHPKEAANISILGYRHKDFPLVFYSYADIISVNESELGSISAEQILARIKNPLAAQKKISISSRLVKTEIDDLA